MWKQVRIFFFFFKVSHLILFSHQLLRVLAAVFQQAQALVGKRVRISFFLCFFQSLFTLTVPVAITGYFERLVILLRNHPTVLVG